MHPYREQAIPDPEPACDVIRMWCNGYDSDIIKIFRALIKTGYGFAKVSRQWPGSWIFVEGGRRVPKYCRPALALALKNYLMEKKARQHAEHRRLTQPWCESEKEADCIQ